MIKQLTIAVLGLLVSGACKGSDKPADKAADKGKPAAADPWAEKKAKVDPNAAKDPDLAKMIEVAQEGGESHKYPQADALVVSDRDDVTIRVDGTVVEHHKSIVKLLDAQRGKEKFADVHVMYDSKRQKLEINTARTVNSDGEAHAASPEEIGDIVPPQLLDATIYSDVRERVVTFPAVDKGSVVELEYTRTTNATPDSAMGGEQMLAQWDPVLERTVTITAPGGLAPKLAVDGMDLKAVESSNADGHVWTYQLKDQPDRHPESGSPTDAAVLPRLVYGFQPSWAKVIEPVAARFIDTAVPKAMPDAIKQEADRIVAGAKTNEEKAQKLFAYVTHDIRSIDLPLGWGGYQPHAPDIVLANKYGDERDKACLLLALAASEGIKGRPVLARSQLVPVITSVPTIAQFDRMLVTLDVDGKETWLGAGDENAQYGVAFSGQDNAVLPLEKGGSEIGHRPPLDPSTSVSHVAATFTLGANGDLDAKYTYEMTGWYADRASGELRPLKGQNLDQFFQNGAGALSAAAVDKGHEVSDTMSVTGPIKVTQHVSVPGYSAAQSTFRVFEMPPVTLGVAAELPSAGLNARKYPLSVFAPRTEKGDVTVQIPVGWKVSYVPPKLEGNADGISYSSSCEAAGQNVTCHDEIKLDKIVVSPEKYPAFHDAMTKLEAYERRIVLLTKA